MAADDDRRETLMDLYRSFNLRDIDAALAVVARHGHAPLRGVANYQDVYKLTYVSGPSGIILMLAQDLRKPTP